MKRGARLALAPWRRDPGAPSAGHKTLNYLELLHTREAVRKKGGFDALLLSPEGNILEGAATNFFMIRDGRLLTPPAAGILPGVARDTVIRIARKKKLPFRETLLRMADLKKADEAFVTNSVVEVMPVSVVGKTEIAPAGPLTLELAEGYRHWVERACGK